ncbi:barH-like 1 homeobox protein [Stylophora pistillata]|uniref:BarH-like 2 homeobox protein n=1 Tax=Stylophora pistillata TaxID=50429 RepID=A0A2B4S5Q7_STYPI|nr:barH-like 1 homeobox protein [Stylophora pistillata]PFX24726.1 BarH-like 2 homeobox protein [Stylophora pistillata]
MNMEKGSSPRLTKRGSFSIDDILNVKNSSVSSDDLSSEEPLSKEDLMITKKLDKEPSKPSKKLDDKVASFQGARQNEGRPSVELKKRPRTAFTNEQINVLEIEFQKSKYLSVARRMELSKLLELSETQIKIWFQNRRTKWKRKLAAEMDYAIAAQGYLYPSHPVWHGPKCYFDSSLTHSSRLHPSLVTVFHPPIFTTTSKQSPRSYPPSNLNPALF